VGGGVTWEGERERENGGRVSLRCCFGTQVEASEEGSEKTSGYRVEGEESSERTFLEVLEKETSLVLSCLRSSELLSLHILVDLDVDLMRSKQQSRPVSALLLKPVSQRMKKELELTSNKCLIASALSASSVPCLLNPTARRPNCFPQSPRLEMSPNKERGGELELDALGTERFERTSSS